jgi:hypothetical protein
MTQPVWKNFSRAELEDEIERLHAMLQVTVVNGQGIGQPGTQQSECEVGQQIERASDHNEAAQTLHQGSVIQTQAQEATARHERQLGQAADRLTSGL